MPGRSTRYMVIVDARTQRIIAVSDDFAALLGYSPVELQGLDAWTFAANAGDARRLQVAANVAAASADYVDDVAVLISRDGQPIEVDYTLRKLNGGAIWATIIHPRDGATRSVSRLRRVADELISRRSRLAEDAARRQREFAAHRPDRGALRALPPPRRKSA